VIRTSKAFGAELLVVLTLSPRHRRTLSSTARTWIRVVAIWGNKVKRATVKAAADRIAPIPQEARDGLPAFAPRSQTGRSFAPNSAPAPETRLARGSLTPNSRLHTGYLRPGAHVIEALFYGFCPRPREKREGGRILHLPITLTRSQDSGHLALAVARGARRTRSQRAGSWPLGAHEIQGDHQRDEPHGEDAENEPDDQGGSAPPRAEVARPPGSICCVRLPQATHLFL
jgi:hypothetical protein